MNKNFSIIIPIYNELSNPVKLINEINNDLQNTNFKNLYEIILIDDGSDSESRKYIDSIHQYSNVKVITNKHNIGQSRSLFIGINSSQFKTIVTIDGDMQNDPSDIKSLLKIYFDQNTPSIICGVRKLRKDSAIKIFSSLVANKFRSFILKDNCPDTGCSLKVFNKDVFISLPFFDGIHRFLPALFKSCNNDLIFFEVKHRPRLVGKSKYGTFKRLIKGLYDLYKVRKIIKNKVKNV